MSLLIIAAGMVLSVGAVVASGASRSSKPSLKISAAAAPASRAFWYFCVNGQVPRWISAIAPAGMPAKSAGSHPLMDVPAPPGGGTTVLPATKIGPVTSPAPENCATM